MNIEGKNGEIIINTKQVDVNLPNPLAIVDIKIFNQFRGKNYMKETMNWLNN